jgi:hypothetical protein
MKAFEIINSHLWSSIAKTEFYADTYARCILTSCAVAEFLRGKGYHAEVVPAVLEVSQRRNESYANLNIVGIGEPTATDEGLHVVCKVTESNGRVWIVDATTRQASKPGRWRHRRSLPRHAPGRPRRSSGQARVPPARNHARPDNDGTHLLFRWFTKDDLPETWRRAPDASPERSAALKRRLDSAWLRARTA